MTRLTLIVDRRGAQLELAGSGILRIRYSEDEVHRVGIKALQRIILVGEVGLSSRVLRACGAAGVGVVLLSRRGRDEAVNLFPLTASQATLRHAQHLLYAQPASRLALARQVVAAKIEQQRLWLSAQGLDDGLERFLKAVPEAQDIATLMGIEGAASARYFATWQQLWGAPWIFTGRSRRPPRDPINALLSLSYTLALNYIGRLASLRGLEPALGFLHEPFRGRPSLALDLLEPVRPWVDQWVWQLLIMHKALSPAQFACSPAEGCRLDKEGRAIYFARWHQAEEEWLRSPARQALALLLKTLRRSPHGGQALMAT